MRKNIRGILFLLFSLFLIWGIGKENEIVAASGDAASIGARFYRPPKAKEFVHPDAKMAEQLTKEHGRWMEGRHIALTLEEEKIIMMLLGYSLVIVASIEFFRRRNI